MSNSWFIITLLFVLAGVASGAKAPARPAAPDKRPAALRKYPTRYYIIHTDLDIEAVREAVVRTTAMAEEYQARTRQFVGRITTAMPFYLFSKAEDYHAAGGLAGSVGIFDGEKLMAVVPGAGSAAAWQIVQHEGFHQYVAAVIGGNMPLWVNEGLAEYFGLAIFTGDGFVTGCIPPRRLKRVRSAMQANEFKSVEAIMAVGHEEWKRQLGGNNYDQVWSMVHFLVHGDDQKYQAAFEGYINDISRSMDWKERWKRRFGTDTAAFEKRWRQWWLGLADDPTAELRQQAAVATIAGFVARALVNGQKFEDMAEFFRLAGEGKVRISPNDWLPMRLLIDNVLAAGKMGAWTLGPDGRGGVRVRCELADAGGTWIAEPRLAGKQVAKVLVRKEPPASQPDHPPLSR